MAAQHYWNDDDAHSQVTHLDQLGVNYTSEEPVWHTWQSICEVYFPRNATNPTDPTFTGFSTKRELHRGPEDAPGNKIPDVVTTQRHLIQTVQMRTLGSGPGAGQTHNKRDILWVECKAPNLDKAHNWNELMTQITGRLQVAHGTPAPNGLGQRKVYFILATGLKWMIFVWDPANTLPPLRFRKEDGGYWPPIHPFVAPVQMNPVTAAPAGVAQQIQITYQHIQRATNGAAYIDYNLADTLDFWTAAPGQPGVPANFRSITLLEVFLNLVRGDTYQGVNPAHWSG